MDCIENLSPLLFSMYMNDLYEFLASLIVCGITNRIEDSSTVKNDFFCMLNFLFYFMPTKQLIFQSADDLQHAIYEFYTYCNQWNLLSMLIKPKLLSFQKAQHQKLYFIFMIKLSNLWKNINNLAYFFSRSGSICKAKSIYMNKLKKRCIVWYVELDNLICH